MNTMKKNYNQNAVDVFSNQNKMDYTVAKSFIDDAYEKRASARAAIKTYRNDGLSLVRKRFKEYKIAQKLAVRAYVKCMSDIK